MDGQDRGEAAIIVEFANSGEQMAVALTAADVVARSRAAVEKALDVTRELAARFIDEINRAAKQPSRAELEFGLKFDIEAGAIIARTSQEASLKVTFVWTRDSAGMPPASSET